MAYLYYSIEAEPEILGMTLILLKLLFRNFLVLLKQIQASK